MKTFIELTVAFTKDQTRKELINVNQVYRIIERSGGGTAVCFNSSGSDYIEVKETRAEIAKMVG